MWPVPLFQQKTIERISIGACCETVAKNMIVTCFREYRVMGNCNFIKTVIKI
jgi:hypothetical protein